MSQLIKQPYSRVRENVQSPGRLIIGNLSVSYPSSATTSSDTTFGYLPPDIVVMTDVVTPGFHALKAKGSVIANPMLRISTRSSFSGATITDVWRSNNSWVYTNRWTNWPGIIKPDYLWLEQNGLGSVAQATIDTALTSAYAGLYEATWQALVDLAEVKSSLGMLLDAIKTAKKLFLRSVVRPRRGGPRRRIHSLRAYKRAIGSSADTAANYWLQWRFGWVPLWQSINDAVTALDKFNETTQRIVSRGFERVNKHAGYSTTTSTWNSQTTTRSGTLRGKVRAGVLAEVTPSLARRFGADMLSMPSNLWELVPWSFVMDRFVNIGDWLSSWTYPPDMVRVLTDWTVTDVETRFLQETMFHSTYYVIPGTQDNVTRTGSSTSFEYVSAVKQRRVGLGRPWLPSFQGLKDFDNLIHQVDHLALLYQKVKTWMPPKRD